MINNFHTHTVRCHHAQGEDEEFVVAAIEAGFKKIGFSDHSPWPFKDFVSPMRMTADELEGYVNSVLTLKEKYKGKIEILLGLECEYFEEYIPWLCAMIEKYGLDYVILGHHYSTNEKGGLYNGNIKDKRDFTEYKKQVIDAMESGLFSYVAHPDIFLKTYEGFDDAAEKTAREIIAKAIETETPLEYNILGIHHGENDGRPGYPHPDFWRVAGEMGATAIIGVDAHKPEAYFEKELFEKSEKLLKDFGLNITDEIRTFK